MTVHQAIGVPKAKQPPARGLKHSCGLRAARLCGAVIEKFGVKGLSVDRSEP
jgi:hypothetical protein